MSFKKFTVAMLVLFVSMLSPGWSQVGRGSLAGAITDTQGGALQGARVAADPGGAFAVTDAQGQFSLNGMVAGDYEVRISYKGFETVTKKVKLLGGQTVRLDISLSIASARENVQVYAGRAGGEIEAINRTFNADNIINVLPADVIKSLPNANVADAIGRLAGVSLERD